MPRYAGTCTIMYEKKPSHHPKKWIIRFHSNGIVNPFLPFYPSYSRSLREVSPCFGNMYNGWMETPAGEKKRVPKSYFENKTSVLFHDGHIILLEEPRLPSPPQINSSVSPSVSTCLQIRNSAEYSTGPTDSIQNHESM